MKTELIVGESAFSGLAKEWDLLLANSMTNTPFQTLAYQKSWWTHLKPQGGQLLTVTARTIEDELRGIGCFFTHEGTLHFNGCIEETDYLDLIASAEDAGKIWQATLQCLDEIDTSVWKTIELCNIPENSPTRSILPDLAHKLNYTFEEVKIEVCPTIQLPDSFDFYLDSLDSKQRRELSRKLRRAEGADVTTTTIGSSEEIDTEVESFLELLQKSTFEKRDWLNDGRRAVFHDVARSAQAGGYLQLMFTAVEGRRAAALFNFDYADRIWVYNSGLDPTAFSALSPGVVLTATAIQQAIQLGRKEFDFLRGDEEYKYRFGAIDTTIYGLRLERPART